MIRRSTLASRRRVFTLYAFLDKQGNEEGNVVGRLPRQYLVENVNALAAGKQSIPHARAVGQYSSSEARKVHQVTDPLSHGERERDHNHYYHHQASSSCCLELL
ncbi:hypothetical protein F2Q69_00033048 [Brassica cretica]|uniref:Uncharacterized protein n=1 Tax=Brassica cretica TaxID=69181 RepID=A0A8S9SVN3_BRACR|nr:hypothetical protein F2Q69_00033048 [Brassica cretica]